MVQPGTQSVSMFHTQPMPKQPATTGPQPRYPRRWLPGGTSPRTRIPTWPSTACPFWSSHRLGRSRPPPTGTRTSGISTLCGTSIAETVAPITSTSPVSPTGRSAGAASCSLSRSIYTASAPALVWPSPSRCPAMFLLLTNASSLRAYTLTMRRLAVAPWFLRITSTPAQSLSVSSTSRSSRSLHLRLYCPPRISPRPPSPRSWPAANKKRNDIFRK